jgi:hypothetical protein
LLFLDNDLMIYAISNKRHVTALRRQSLGSKTRVADRRGNSADCRRSPH